MFGTFTLTVEALKNWRAIAIALTFLFLVPLIAIFAPFAIDKNTPEAPNGGVGGQAVVSEAVRRYEPIVREFAAKYGVEGYTEILLAKMMQESGGQGGDPMQASESLGLPPNAITNPVVSIEAGVKYFSQVFKQAKGDIKLTLQAYNFGGGFIPYALERGGYSKEVAADFSAMMAAKMGWSRYGDINYVDNVLRYFEGSLEAQPVNSYGWTKPANGEITSPFGTRFDPFSGVPTFHKGADLGCNRKPIPIYAAKPGKVSRAGWENPNNHKQGYGKRIYISHSEGLETVYAHLSNIMVKPGQEVKQGQQIGTCGTTGSSTGEHLHFELKINGVHTNPVGRVFN